MVKLEYVSVRSSHNWFNRWYNWFIN